IMTTIHPTDVPAPSAGANRKGQLFVLQTGLITSALALLGVWWLSWYEEINPMGWYVNFILPAGAVLVGLVAASGYGIAAWLSGLKIGRGLLAAMAGLLILAYFGALYL